MLITICLGWVLLLTDAATPFTEEDQENDNRPIYLHGQGLGSSRSTNDLPSIHSRVRVYQGRVSVGVEGTLEGLSEFRAYVQDDFGEVHDVSIHCIEALEPSYHSSSTSIEHERRHQAQVVPDQGDNFRNVISSSGNSTCKALLTIGTCMHLKLWIDSRSDFNAQY